MQPCSKGDAVDIIYEKSKLKPGEGSEAAFEEAFQWGDLRGIDLVGDAGCVSTPAGTSMGMEFVKFDVGFSLEVHGRLLLGSRLI